MAVTCSAVVPSGILYAPWVTAISAVPMAADIVCDPARMPPAAPAGSPSIPETPTTSARPMNAQTTARIVNRRPSFFRLLKKAGPTRRPTPYMKR